MNKRLRKSARLKFINGGPYHPDHAARCIKELWPNQFADKTPEQISQEITGRLPLNEVLDFKDWPQ